TPDGTVAPGSIISIYGDNLSPSLQVGPTNPLSQTLANVTVTVSDRLLPLFFVSPQQINAQVPSDLPDGDYTIQVHSLGQPDVVGAFTISRDAPGIFTQQNDQNLPLALALHEDGTVVTFDSPARRNETVSIYGTGFGPYDHKVIDGFPIASTDNISVVDPVTVTTGDIDLHPDWTGAAKNMVGMTVVKLKIIDDMPAAANVDLTVLVNGKTSNKVTLPVQ
ncbi:MAG TPA: IPT/TIG domain-containing protein, partial [Gemmatimonadaceae bacterium]